MKSKSWLAAAVCAAAIAGIGADAAFAGEVNGNGAPTAAPAHANSICAFSGLNDYVNGQSESRVQTPADAFKYYGLPPGVPGTACRGGSNPDNPPS
jgi:hypothetical protein